MSRAYRAAYFTCVRTQGVALVTPQISTGPVGRDEFQPLIALMDADKEVMYEAESQELEVCAIRIPDIYSLTVYSIMSFGSFSDDRKKKTQQIPTVGSRLRTAPVGVDVCSLNRQC